MEPVEFHVLKEWAGKTLQEVLSIALAVSRGEAKKLIDQKCVFVNNRRTWIAKHVVKLGDSISISSSLRKPTAKVFRFEDQAVLYKDADLLIVNKPPGIISNGAGSFEALLQKSFKDRNIKAVHRLDRDTSGCIIFSRSQKTWDALYECFKDHAVEKVYHVLVVGAYTGGERIITTPIDGKEACSQVRMKKQIGDLSLLEVVIKTGRTHQIRKHLLSIGLPVLGDKDYSSKRSESARFRGAPRQMLHAWKLALEHPIDGKKITVQAPYPEDFSKLLKRGL